VVSQEEFLAGFLGGRRLGFSSTFQFKSAVQAGAVPRRIGRAVKAIEGVRPWCNVPGQADAQQTSRPANETAPNLPKVVIGFAEIILSICSDPCSSVLKTALQPRPRKP
jgi:hypothetical protein